jgi:SPP1 gp7 family putative phage head morphogenesis protein
MPGDPLAIGLNVPFAQAIKAAQQRKVVLPDIYYGELQGLERQLAFSIAGVASLDQLTIVRDSLAAKLQSGQTFNQWKKDILESGTLDLPRHRLDNIFRTNIQGCYNRGRWERFVAVKDERPYLMYDAINDSRVRPSHLAMDNIIRPVDDAFWASHAPSNGYRCRCRLISLTAEQAQARSGAGHGLNKAVNGVEMEPDKGWDYNPGQDLLAGVKSAMANKQGKSGPVLLSALNTKIAADMKIITLPGFAVVQEKLADIASKNPEWFPLGYSGIHAVSNPELYAAFNPEKALFYVSAADDPVLNFNAAQELTAALESIKAQRPLTFKNEYAIETLWHEIIHGITGIAPVVREIGKDSIQEGVVQLIARHSYHKLAIALGYSAAHQSAIINGGYAYRQATGNLLSMADMAGVDVFSFAELIIKESNDWRLILSQLLADGMNLKAADMQPLFNQAERINTGDFKEKIKVKIRNARRNKGAL